MASRFSRERMTPTVQPAVEHIFTVDVEDYFHVHAFEGTVSRSEWRAFPSRIVRNVDVLLELLAGHGVTGTFFVLGWVADVYPEVVRRIAGAGHEVASHGWWHRKVPTLAPEEFRTELRASKELLEDLSGQPVVGFRAPSFSIVPGHEWAFDILLEEGYRYDSSLFPIRRSGYGYPSAPPIAHFIRRPAGVLAEFPLATTVCAGVRLPAAGGGYLRHLPYALVRRAFREHSECGIPGMFYIHPWEVDPDQPRLQVKWLTRLRHYNGLEDTVPRLHRLLAEFRFTSAVRQLSEKASWAEGAARAHRRTVSGVARRPGTSDERPTLADQAPASAGPG